MYWNYLERHPNHVPLPPNAEQEARDALAWFHLGTAFRSGDVPGHSFHFRQPQVRYPQHGTVLEAGV
jgi:hypothetical protein